MKLNKKLDDKFAELTESNEGRRSSPYFCTAGKITVGVGRNLQDNPLSDNEIDYLFKRDRRTVVEDLHEAVEGFWTMPEPIQLVLCDMRFQLGPSRFRGFEKMIAAAEEHRWADMIEEMKDSKWCEQTPNRARKLIDIIGDYNGK